MACRCIDGGTPLVADPATQKLGYSPMGSACMVVAVLLRVSKRLVFIERRVDRLRHLYIRLMLVMVRGKSHGTGRRRWFKSSSTPCSRPRKVHGGWSTDSLPTLCSSIGS